MKHISLIFLCIVSTFTLSAQEKNVFNIPIPQQKIKDCQYNNLQYIESRDYPNAMGYVYMGVWSGTNAVQTRIPLDIQVDSVIKALSDQSVEGRTLAFQMRKLNFGMDIIEGKEKAICKLRFTLYEMDGNENYYFINTLDTLVIAGNKGIISEASNAVIGFLSDNVRFLPEEGEPALTFDEVGNIALFEKNSIPLYVQKNLPDGVYLDYYSFSILKPSETSMTVTKDASGDLKEVKIPNIEKPGKERKLKNQEAYVVVLDGTPYIEYDRKYRAAYKKNDNWNFVISQKVQNSGFSIGIGIGGGRGGVGGGIGIPIGGKKEYIEMFIDHLNGDFYFGEKFE